MAERLGVLVLRDDPQFGRIPQSRAPALVAAALADGQCFAEDLAARLGRCPDALAEALRVPVRDLARDSDYGTTVVYAEYLTRPPRIRLYRRPLQALARHLQPDAPGAPLAIEDVRAIYLAHELYHHLDATRSGPSLAAQHRVTVCSVGRWRWTSGLASLPEIAAGAFAQALLGLRYHPKLLDLFTLFDAGPQAAARFVAALTEVCMPSPRQSRGQSR
jgi:hypothetical protein